MKPQEVVPSMNLVVIGRVLSPSMKAVPACAPYSDGEDLENDEELLGNVLPDT